MRRLALFVLLSGASACNAVLDIPERPLAVDDDATTIDATTDTQADTPLDTLSDGTVDSGSDGAIPDGTTEDSAADAGDDGTTDADTTDADTAVDDTAVDDTAIDVAVDGDVDTGVEDTEPADTGPADTGVTDTGPVDTGVDTGPADTGAPDTGAPDTGPPDTGPPDTGPSCGVTGASCCGAVPGTCDKGAVCAAEATTPTCEAVSDACTRASDCTGVCTGPTLCDGKVCFTCKTSLGTVPIGGACTSSGECTTAVCDRSRNTCTVTCANAITGNADCAALGSNGVCTASNVTVTSGPTSATGWVGFCAYGCGRDGDCKSGEVCRPFGNQVADRLDVTCAPPRTGATVDYGGACTTSGQCKGGTCVTVGATSQCTEICTTSADCTGPWKKCEALDFSRPISGGPQAIKHCVP